jgi:hypothetical protein
MSDLPSSLPQTSDEVPRVLPQPAKKSYRWLIITLAGLLGLTCLCVGVVAVLVIRNIAQMPADMQAVEEQIDLFMQAGLKHDPEAAFALFSSRGQQKMPLSAIQKLFGHSNYPLFTGYESLMTTSYRFHSDPNGDQDSDDGLPDGAFAILHGVLNYEGGASGTFDATLEQVGSEWKLYDILIGVPPNKYHNNSSG